jgi:hypothetical protein
MAFFGYAQPQVAATSLAFDACGEVGEEEKQVILVRGVVYQLFRLIQMEREGHPYCACNEKYSCPLVPKENDLPVGIRAGVRIANH